MSLQIEAYDASEVKKHVELLRHKLVLIRGEVAWKRLELIQRNVVD
jgi:hypothetical protein